MSIRPSRRTPYLFIRARFLLAMDPDLPEGIETRIEDGYVLTQAEKILEVGHFTEEIGQRILESYSSDDITVLGASDSGERFPMIDGCLLPGFITAHCHDHESPLIGLAKDVPLTAWLDDAVNLFTGMMDEDTSRLTKLLGRSPYLVTYLKARVDQIQYGVTATCTHHCNFNKYHVPEILEANERAGTKMVVAVGAQDRHYDPRILDTPEKAIERMDTYHALAQECERTTVVPGPDQLFSNGPELLQALKQWARDHGTVLHMHSSEEPNTTKWFKETYGQTPVEYAHSIGILDSDTIFAHQVHSTDHDLELLASTGTKIVHNPLANTILGSGMPDVPLMREMSIPVAVSTDGSGSADNQNILSAARLASQYQRGVYARPEKLPAIELLEMITRIPAQYYGFNSGSLKPGLDADIILFDLTRPNVCPTHIENVVENLIWASDGSEIRFVVANGFVVKDDYRHTTLDVSHIIKDIQSLTMELLEYRKSHRVVGTGVHTE